MLENLINIEGEIPVNKSDIVSVAAKISNSLELTEEFDTIVKILEEEINPLRKIKKFVEKKYSINISDQSMGRLSVFLEGIKKAGKLKLEFSNKIDWEAGEFSDESSCYWGDRRMAKKILLLNEGKAIKIYSERGKSRCWAYPIDEDSFVIFNCYSSEHLILEDIAKIITKYLAEKNISAGFKRVFLQVSGDNNHLLYINSNAGILISTRESFLYENSVYINPIYFCDNCGEKIKWDNYDYDTDGIFCGNCSSRQECEVCGNYFHLDEMMEVGGYYYCEDCYEEIFSYCERCEDTFERDDLIWVEGEGYYCEDCFEKTFAYCERCGDPYRYDDLIWVEDEGYYCESCAEQETYYCEFCENTYLKKEIISVEGRYCCRNCANKEKVDFCVECGNYFFPENLVEIDECNYCLKCAEKYRKEKENE